MNILFHDVKYGFRIILKKPAMTAVAILTLALGIGANTVIFSGVYAILFRPLPYENSDRLVKISSVNKQTGQDLSVSYPDFTEWREQSRIFERVAAFTNWNINMPDEDGTPKRIKGIAVSEGFFDLLGIKPVQGRTFLPEEQIPGGNNVAIVSHSFWQQRLGAGSELTGNQINLNDRIFTVVGILPASLDYPPDTDIWVPLSSAVEASTLQDRKARFLQALASVKPGITIRQADQETNALARSLERQHPDTNEGIKVNIVSLQEARAGKYRTPLLILQLAVGFVLLIACANLANMLLAQAGNRQKEFAIRLAMGSSRGRLIRQLLTESLMLALLGGALGLLLAEWGISYLAMMAAERLPRLNEFGPIGIDGQTLAFTLAVSIATGLIFGIIPALLASGPDINESLKEGGKSSSPGRSHRRAARLLVVSEVALAVVLLICAGLMIRTFNYMVNADPGFNPENVLTMKITLPEKKYADYQQRAIFFESVTNRIEALPGVESLGAVSYLPLIGWNPRTFFTIAGQSSSPPDQLPRADFQPVNANYFRSMGISVMRGRHFAQEDVRESPEVAIINEAMARIHWPGKDPLGERIRLGEPASDSKDMVIIGVVRDVRQYGLHTLPRPEIYIPGYRPTMTFTIRATVDPASMAGKIREQITAVDEQQPVYNISTMNEILASSVESRRLNAIMLGSLGGVALLLAAMGIYGMMSYSVSRRTQEIGIRMALGAESRDVIRMVLKEGITTVMIGIGAGLIGAYFATRVMAGLIYEVSAANTTTFIVVPLILAGVALAATIFPALKAAKTDPIEALRYE